MIQGEKYRNKIEILEQRYRDTEEEKIKAPPKMEKYSHLSVFKYEEIKVEDIGEEENILRRHPKFAIMQNLHENAMK